MFSMNSYLNHTKDSQMVRAEKGDFARSRNWSNLKLSLELIESSMEGPKYARLSRTGG